MDLKREECLLIHLEDAEDGNTEGIIFKVAIGCKDVWIQKMKVHTRGGGVGKKLAKKHLTTRSHGLSPLLPTRNLSVSARAPTPATNQSQKRGEYNRPIPDEALEGFMFPLWELTPEEYSWLTFTKSKTRRTA